MTGCARNDVSSELATTSPADFPFGADDVGCCWVARGLGDDVGCCRARGLGVEVGRCMPLGLGDELDWNG